MTFSQAVGWGCATASVLVIAGCLWLMAHADADRLRGRTLHLGQDVRVVEETFHGRLVAFEIDAPLGALARAIQTVHARTPLPDLTNTEGPVDALLHVDWERGSPTSCLRVWCDADPRARPRDAPFWCGLRIHGHRLPLPTTTRELEEALGNSL